MLGHDKHDRIDELARRLDAESAGPELPPVEAYADEPAAHTNGSQPSSAAPRPVSVPLLGLLWFATLRDAVHQEQIVKNLLLAGSLFVVFGESNSGKTFWVLDLCLAIAAGKPWRGRTTRRGLVVYIAGEGANSVRSRVAAYRAANPEIGDGLPFAIVPQAVDFMNPGSVLTLIETVQAAEAECGEKAALLIIDTFARAIPGANENDAADVGTAVAHADALRMRLGCCVGFVHHAGKDPTKGARGSSALRAATDTEILIEGLTGPRTATVTKQRDLEAGAPMPFDLVAVEIGMDPDDGQPVTSCVVKHVEADERPAPVTVQLRGKAQRQLVAALRARSKDDADRIWRLDEMREVGRELGQSKSTARYAVDALVTTSYLQPVAFGGYKFVDGELRC